MEALEWGVLQEDKWEGLKEWAARTVREGREWEAQEDHLEWVGLVWADFDLVWGDHLVWAALPALAARVDHPSEWAPAAREDHNDSAVRPAVWARPDLAVRLVAAPDRTPPRDQWAPAVHPPT